MKLSNMRKGFVVFLISVSFTFSCSTSEPVNPDMGFDYFPLSIGNYSIFLVQETKIALSVETKTSYELKVSITDSNVNDQGDTTYVIHRAKRANSSASWENQDTWSAKLSNNRILQNEGNVTFVKLLFPPSLNLMWNGNLFNNLPDHGNIFNDRNSDQYYISYVNTPVTLPSGFQTDQSLTVVHNDYVDHIIGTDIRMEVYAKGAGLIYKEIRQLEYCTNPPSCTGQQKVAKGVILIQSLKEYGRQ